MCSSKSSGDVATEASALIALGSNLDTPLAQLRRAKAALEDLGDLTSSSHLYRTVPVGGPEGQADYLNAVVQLLPSDSYNDPRRLLRALLAIEREQGRVRSERYGPRTLDLDLLAYGEVRLATAALTLPHPEMMHRAFVLVPLCEIAPDFQHPVTGETACEALHRLNRSGVTKTALSW